MNILLIDNYDSFVYNLYQMLGEVSGVAPIVFRNDQITIEVVCDMNPDAIVLSPGPGHPANKRDFGVCADILSKDLDVPILGVCLGHQGIGLYHGQPLSKAKQVMHGKTSRISHNGDGIFKNIPNPFIGARYHSLAISKVTNNDLEVTAVADDGEIMGVQHRTKKIYGVQFHPESIMTQNGKDIVSNFVEICGW